MLKLEIFKLKIGSRHLFHFSTLIFIISNNVMFISDIVYISFALIICIINQIYLLNRSLYNQYSQYSFWGFPSQGQTLYFFSFFFCHGTNMVTNWNIKEECPCDKIVFPCKPVWILNTGVFKKEKHLSFIIWSWHQRSGQK